MTLKDLKRLHALNREIEYEKQRLFSLRQRCDHVSVIGIGAIKRNEHLSQIQMLERRVEEHLGECIALYNEILDFIDSISDPLIRLAVSLKYINALEWGQIALHIGGGNTAEGVRKACERFIKKALNDSMGCN